MYMLNAAFDCYNYRITFKHVNDQEKLHNNANKCTFTNTDIHFVDYCCTFISAV